MEYPHKYFEDEVREGFYVNGEIKRVWAAQLEVLFEIDKLCKKHNIKWYADNGTLLGAIRHKGYIPWDDDLDICMLRDDYVRFKKIADKELPEGFLCLSLWDEDPFYEYIMRVTNGKKFNYENEFLKKYHDCQYPMGVDIFPLDYISTNKKKEDERKKIALQVFACADALGENGEDEKDPAFIELVTAVENLCGVKIDKKRPIKQQMYMAAESIFTMFGSKGAKEVALMTYWIQHDNHVYPIECFRESVPVMFEGVELPAPIEFDEVLHIEYGDYMQLYKAGGVHGYPFFEQLEDLLIEKIDKYYFRYKFNTEDLKNDGRNKTTKDQVIDYINMTKEAHGAIVAMISQDKINVACDLLAACQESTINIGNLIEAAYGEGYSAVLILEEYCESVYQLYHALAQGEFVASDAEGVSGYLLEIYMRMYEILNEQVVNRKEMIFIPYRADYWKNIEGMWQAAIDSGEYDVYVVPIPYYKKSSRSELTDMYYEGNEFPDYVEITDYKDYNIEKRHPDVIVTQNPFDECNYVISIEKGYYSRNIKKYTDKLIYVSPYIIDEIEDEDSKAWKTLDYFCAVPGVVRADKVMVQSNKMRETYIKRLTLLSGEEYESVWKDKVCVYDYPVTDITKEDLIKEKEAIISGLPKEWKEKIIKPDSDLKKILLYNVSVASFAQYGDKLVTKIENNLNVFRDVKDDVVIIWYESPHLQKILKRTNLVLKDKYNRLIDIFKNEKLGIYNEGNDYGMLLKLCDAYYGDPGDMAHFFRNERKPVMLQNVEII